MAASKEDEHAGHCGLFAFWCALVTFAIFVIHNTQAWQKSTCTVTGFPSTQYSCCCRYGLYMMCIQRGCVCTLNYWAVLESKENRSEQISIRNGDNASDHPLGSTAVCWWREGWSATWNNPREILPWAGTALALLFFCACTLSLYCCWPKQNSQRDVRLTRISSSPANPFHQI